MTEFGVPLPTAASNDKKSMTTTLCTKSSVRFDLKRLRIAIAYGLSKWKVFNDPTPMWRSHLARQTCNVELLEEIEDAVDRCRTKLNGAEADEEDDTAYAEHDEQTLAFEASAPQRHAIDDVPDRSVLRLYRVSSPSSPRALPRRYR